MTKRKSFRKRKSFTKRKRIQGGDGGNMEIILYNPDKSIKETIENDLDSLKNVDLYNKYASVKDLKLFYNSKREEFYAIEIQNNDKLFLKNKYCFESNEYGTLLLPFDRVENFDGPKTNKRTIHIYCSSKGKSEVAYSSSFIDLQDILNTTSNNRVLPLRDCDMDLLELPTTPGNYIKYMTLVDRVTRIQATGISKLKASKNIKNYDKDIVPIFPREAFPFEYFKMNDDSKSQQFRNDINVRIVKDSGDNNYYRAILFAFLETRDNVDHFLQLMDNDDNLYARIITILKIYKKMNINLENMFLNWSVDSESFDSQLIKAFSKIVENYIHTNESRTISSKIHDKSKLPLKERHNILCSLLNCQIYIVEIYCDDTSGKHNPRFILNLQNTVNETIYDGLFDTDPSSKPKPIINLIYNAFDPAAEQYHIFYKK